MNYQKVLEEKGIEKTDLSVSLQKGIKEIEKLKSQLLDFEVVPESELDEEEIASLSVIKDSIGVLDGSLAKKIEKFNVESHRKKVIQLKEVVKKRNEKGKFEVQEAVQEAAPILEEPIIEEAPEQYNPPKLDDKMKDMRKSYENDKKHNHPRQQIQEEDVEVEEVEEFSKIDNAKPKKMSKALILMGVGAFFLTWGAVNFFKESK